MNNMILMIDNFDSFTFNLVQYLYDLNQDVQVVRNNDITTHQIKQLNPTHIVISPGPGRPDNAGVSLDVVNNLKNHYPILGVCLGHQTIGQAYGSKIINAKNIMHGKLSTISHDQKGIFQDIGNQFKATRYHSLVIDKNTLSEEITITATSEDDEIMGIQHKNLPIYGVQFHPESIISEYGHKLLENFLKT